MGCKLLLIAVIKNSSFGRTILKLLTSFMKVFVKVLILFY
ncbi:hypothetical protein Gohar_028111 [Gossypium harknessii]|uniref:Uncharacterized protein n=1 Tax=Gossypium harknessii TaxID=34285 RepID=A0A7J9I874_9ROSI|nr:hypothetical protein [Gossypium harknessii]